MKAKEQAKFMIKTHGENALKEHDKIMNNIKTIYGGDENRAKKESMSYKHLIQVKEEIEVLTKKQPSSKYE